MVAKEVNAIHIAEKEKGRCCGGNYQDYHRYTRERGAIQWESTIKDEEEEQTAIFAWKVNDTSAKERAIGIATSPYLLERRSYPFRMFD